MVLQEGRQPLPCCDMCGIHIPVGRMLKYWRTAHCFKNIEIRIRCRDVEVGIQCMEMELILTRDYGEEIIEGVVLFKYLGQPLDQSDDDWLAFRRKIIKSHQVWGRLRVTLRQEG